MKTKQLNPYEHLKRDFLKVISKIRYPAVREMWFYPIAKLNEGWKLTDLNERVKAADQLDYDCVLKSTEAGLVVQYRKRITDSDIPWNLR